MRPVLFRIPVPWGEIPVHSYGLMIVLGFLLAAHVANRESRRRGMPDFIYDMGLVMLLSGLFGGRLFYFVENWEDKYAGETHPFLEFFKIWKGGLVFYGGAIAGCLGGIIYCWKKKLPVLACMDMAAVGAPIGMAFGRLGCYLNGCCFGTLCDPASPIGLVFPANSPAADAQRLEGVLPYGAINALPVHPIQLYQAAHDFLLAGLLLWYLRRDTAPRGSGMPLLFTLYGVGRFFLEGLRDDNPPVILGLTISQTLSVALVLGCGSAFMVLLVFCPNRLNKIPRNLAKKI